MYFLPHLYDTADYKVDVDPRDIEEFMDHSSMCDPDFSIDFEEFAEIIMSELGLHRPTNVKEGFDLYIQLIGYDINVLPPKSTYYISDHCFAECQLSTPGPNILVKEVSYRKFKQIDMENFRSDIVSSVLCNSEWTSLEELAQCYDTTLSQILDKHAPVNTKILTVRPRVPWFSLELKKLKISRRKLENVEIEITAG